MLNLAMAVRNQSYLIPYSCRYDSADSSYHKWALLGDDPGHSDQITISLWCKRATIGSAQMLVSGRGANDDNWFSIGFNASNQIWIYNKDGGAVQGTANTTDTYTSIADWIHVFLAIDNTLASNALRWQLYVGGAQVSLTFTDATVLNGDYNLFREALNVGRQRKDVQYYFNGKMAEVILLHNLAQAASDFGKTRGGVWVPKEYLGSYGSLGVRFDYADSALLGNDVSGNDNDFTDEAIGADHQLTDTPTS